MDLVVRTFINSIRRVHIVRTNCYVLTRVIYCTCTTIQHKKGNKTYFSKQKMSHTTFIIISYAIQDTSNWINEFHFILLGGRTPIKHRKYIVLGVITDVSSLPNNGILQVEFKGDNVSKNT